MSNAADFFGTASSVAMELKQKLFLETNTNVTENYTITAGKNALTAGPITIDDGISVTIPSGSVWTVV